MNCRANTRSMPAARSDLCPFLTDTVKKARKCWFLENSFLGMRRGADTKVSGRSSEMRRGPSNRRAQNASAALENFVPPSKGFSTVSTLSGHCCSFPDRYSGKPDLRRPSSNLSTSSGRENWVKKSTKDLTRKVGSSSSSRRACKFDSLMRPATARAIACHA